MKYQLYVTNSKCQTIHVINSNSIAKLKHFCVHSISGDMVGHIIDNLTGEILIIVKDPGNGVPATSYKAQQNV